MFLLTMPTSAGGKLNEPDLINYLVQSMCLDELGRPIAGTPLDANCRSKRPQVAGDRVFYRKHDWSNATDKGRAATGYQASDSVVAAQDGRMWVIQTFDFGDAPRTFGKFDAGQGDGGQLLVMADGWASAIMTEDGGAGVQWFIGPGCRAAPKTDARFVSWIFFGDDAQPGVWQSVFAHLNRETSPAGCPFRFNTAYTRYRADQITMTFRLVTRKGNMQSINRSTDVVISEHYGGDDIAHADHLERFYFGRDLGLVRWERWENFAAARPTEIHRMADLITSSERCMPLRYSEAPGARWRMIDCRSWTMLVEEDATWSVDMYQWPALDAIGLRTKGGN
jgi:hypothetical protein